MFWPLVVCFRLEGLRDIWRAVELWDMAVIWLLHSIFVSEFQIFRFTFAIGSCIVAICFAAFSGEELQRVPGLPLWRW